MTHTSTDQPEALPCPFCGGHSTLDSNGQDFRVFCWDCGAKSKEFHCWQKAEAAWNRRTPASKAQRVPLSVVDAIKQGLQADEATRHHCRGTTNWATAMTRFYERAHGITQEKQGCKKEGS